MSGDGSGPALGLSTTHDVVFQDGNVVKRFRGRSQAGARREWQALSLLARYAPGLAPEPVSERLVSDPPIVRMSVVPGRPLGPGSVSEIQLDALVAAVDRLHHALPDPVLGRMQDAGILAHVAARAEHLAGRAG